MKKIYVVKKDIQLYPALCEKTVATPKDYESIPMLYNEKKHLADALAWVEKGLTLEKKRERGNQSSYGPVMGQLWVDGHEAGITRQAGTDRRHF